MSLTTGAILPTLLRLALPNVLAMAMSVLVGIAETRYVGLLGTTPLASALLQMSSGGALGLGFGPVPRLGLFGVALGQMVATGAGVAFLVWWLGSGRARLQLGWRAVSPGPRARCRRSTSGWSA